MNVTATSHKIKSITVKNFTVFTDAELKFKDLNVMIGENGAGKTHLLKLLYTALAVGQRPGGQSTLEKERSGPGTKPSKGALESKLTEKLVGVFKPKKSKVGRLARRRQGQNRCSVKVEMIDGQKSVGFDFSTRSSKVGVTSCPGTWYDVPSVFLPTHELISIQQGFVWVSGTYDLGFDETWSDTCKLLGAPKMRGRPKADTSDMSKRLKDTLGGTVVFDKVDGNFYLRQSNGLMEMPLVAEGMRKVGTLSYLIDSGQMGNINCLFWDEPESNLNPKIIRTVADAISSISRSGTQVFVATHSIFLLRELELIQARCNDRYLRYFALENNKDGVNVHQADSIYDIEPCVALDETNDQAERFLEEIQ